MRVGGGGESAAELTGRVLLGGSGFGGSTMVMETFSVWTEGAFLALAAGVGLDFGLAAGETEDDG